MARLHRSGISQETQSRRDDLIQGMIGDLERTVRILGISISTEEEGVRVYDRSLPAYPMVVRTLIARRDNLLLTIDALRQRGGALVTKETAQRPGVKRGADSLGYL